MCECGFPSYQQYRTGLTFREVRKNLSREQHQKYERGEYMFVTRATVLGRWHEIKLKMFSEENKLHQQFCEG